MHWVHELHDWPPEQLMRTARDREHLYTDIDPDGHHVVNIPTHMRYDWADLESLTEWCRAQWGDTDHWVNPNYKWRRRMNRFYFNTGARRDLFLLHVSTLKHDQDYDTE